MLYYILYKSTADHTLTAQQLQAILLKSQRNNQALGITGILLFVEGTFVQLLEGRQGDLKTLYTAIAQDTRHYDSVVLTEGPLLQRHFPNWSMGLRSLTFEELASHSCFRDLNADTFIRFQIRNSEHPALQQLKSYYAPELIDW